MIDLTSIKAALKHDGIPTGGQVLALIAEVERLRAHRDTLAGALEDMLNSHDEDVATAGDSNAQARMWEKRIQIVATARAALDKVKGGGV